MLNLKRIHKTICASVLAVSMMLPGMTAFATGSGWQKDETSNVPYSESAGDIIKIVNTSGDGIKYSDYSYTIKFEQESQGTDAASGEATNATTIGIDPVTIGGVSQNLTATVDKGTNTQETHTGHWTRTVTGGFELDGFDTPGIYTYKVTMEDNNALPSELSNVFGTSQASKWVSSKAEYRLRVYVEDLGDHLVQTVTLEQTKDQDGSAMSSSEANDNKVQSLEFDNTYGISTLSLTKKVVGEEPEVTATSTTQQVMYTFTLEKGARSKADLPSTLYYYVKNSNGTISSLQSCTLSKSKATIQIAKDQTAIFLNIPVDENAVTIDETCYNTWSQLKQIKVDINTESDSDEGEPKDNTKNHKKSNLKNSSTGTTVTYTNYFEKDMIVTGVVTDIAPYITIVVLAIAAIAAYIIIRKRMR